MHPIRPGEILPEHVRTYLQLTRLLDGIQHDHPEVSGPLRLILLRARRDGQIGSLDASGFGAVVADARRSQHVSTEPSSVPRT